MLSAVIGCVCCVMVVCTSSHYSKDFLLQKLPLFPSVFVKEQESNLRHPSTKGKKSSKCGPIFIKFDKKKFLSPVLMQLSVLTYYSDDSPKYGLGQTDWIGLAGTAHDLSESPLTNEQWKLVLWGMFMKKVLSLLLGKKCSKNKPVWDCFSKGTIWNKKSLSLVSREKGKLTGWYIAFSDRKSVV